MRLQQRLLFATKHVLSRCENSSQDLWCSKTSTSHTYKTERKGYWQLFDTCDNSTEYQECLRELIHASAPSTWTIICIKTCIK